MVVRSFRSTLNHLVSMLFSGKCIKVLSILSGITGAVGAFGYITNWLQLGDVFSMGRGLFVIASLVFSLALYAFGCLIEQLDLRIVMMKDQVKRMKEVNQAYQTSKEKRTTMSFDSSEVLGTLSDSESTGR